MKRIILLIALILAPALSFAQTNAQQNEAGTSYLPNAGNISSNIAVDRALRQIVTLSAGVASVNNPVKNEDTAQTSGDAGIPALAVRNEGTTSFADSNLDYSFLGVNRFGGLYVEMASDHQFAGNSTSLLKNEDSVSASGDAGVGIFGVLRSALVAPAAASDYSFLQQDESGRLITSLSPAAESFTSCSASATGVVDVAIKEAVASNRIYVTSISCANTAGAVSTELAIDDGATLMDVGYVSSTTLGESVWTKTYPVPLRGSVNTALNVKPTTTASATRCCAQGYISVN